MANQEQLEILKRGSEVWNKWRIENPTIKINLTDANLRKDDLRGVYLGDVDLSRADLREADLKRADISKANLVEADLSGCHLSRAHLSGAYLSRASLIEADLILADLRGADLKEAKLNGARSGGTTFTNVDLSNTKGLESIKHYGASILGTDTLSYSRGKIPEEFLRGCGLSDWEIEAAKLYNPELTNEERNKILYKIYDLQVSQAIQISPLFISYSHADSEFVDRMEQALNEKGIRFWRDIHDMKAGRIEKQIDRAISQNPTVLIILSKNSLNSDWVQHEVRKARELEKEIGRDVLCPIALDDSWRKSNWPQRIMEQITEYHILDFSKWDDGNKFYVVFNKLIDGLNLFYKKDEKS